MQSDNDAFIIVSKIGAFCFYWQVLFLIFVQRKLIDDLSDYIEASLNKIFIDFNFVIGLSEYLIPFLSTQVILRVEIALQSVVAHEVTVFTGVIVITLAAACLGWVPCYPKVLN